MPSASALDEATIQRGAPSRQLPNVPAPKTTARPRRTQPIPLHRVTRPRTVETAGRCCTMQHVDLLRRAAGARRRSRFWDRGMWFCGITAGVLLSGVAAWSLAASALGTPISASVTSCSTELHLHGRHVTSCDVTISSGALAGHHMVDTAARHRPGTVLRLIAFNHSLSDPALNHAHGWLLPIGIALIGASWWMGFPARRAKTSGKRARNGRSRLRRPDETNRPS